MSILCHIFGHREFYDVNINGGWAGSHCTRCDWEWGVRPGDLWKSDWGLTQTTSNQTLGEAPKPTAADTDSSGGGK